MYSWLKSAEIVRNVFKLMLLMRKSHSFFNQEFLKYMFNCNDQCYGITVL